MLKRILLVVVILSCINSEFAVDYIQNIMQECERESVVVKQDVMKIYEDILKMKWDQIPELWQRLRKDVL